MKQGDFTSLAKDYINRAGYSHTALKVIARWINASPDQSYVVADVGAGTGKLTQELLLLGFTCIAIEPNDAMRSEGEKLVTGSVSWRKGSGERTALESGSIDWLLMGSSFHWVDFKAGLTEFHRVLKPGGFFTAIWNPRDLERSPLHQEIENAIHECCPWIKRASSGSGEFTKHLLAKLTSTGQFKDSFLVEALHDVLMSRERYLGAWNSVNDIQAQAGEDGFKRIMSVIEAKIERMTEISVPYKTRAWTAQKV